MALRGYSEIVFGIVDLRIATYNILTDTFGTAIEVPEAQGIEFSFIADNDSIKATGAMRHLLSVITHAEFKFSKAGFPFAALAAMTGASNASSGTTPTRTRRWSANAGGAGLPYFAMVGKLVGENGDDLHAGLAVCKLDTIPSWKAEQNKFVIKEASGKAIERNNGKLVYLLGHETAASIDFNEIFAA